HVRVSELDGPECPYCHARGCLTTLVGAQALLDRAGAAASRRFKSFKTLVNYAREEKAGGPVRAVLANAGALMGEALAPLVTALNPDRVVMGGMIDPDAYFLVSDGL